MFIFRTQMGPNKAGPWFLASVAFVLTFRLCNCLKSAYSLLVTVGSADKSNNVPTSLEVSNDASHLYLAGTSKPRQRRESSAFGEPLSDSLRGSDIFLTKIDLKKRIVSWTVRDGTVEEEAVEATLLDRKGHSIFVAGSTFGDLSGRGVRGINDLFVAKYKVAGFGVAAREWARPLMVGTSGSESATAMAADGDLVYIVGYTTGSLFGKSMGSSDAVIFAIDERTASIRYKAQFGGPLSDRAVALAIGTGKAAAVVVAVETERKVGKTILTNMKLYKFSKILQARGDLLQTTFARESVAGLHIHPQVPDSVFVIGTSKLDESKREDIFFRRVSLDTRNSSSIGSRTVKLSDTEAPEFTMRVGGSGRSYDYAKGSLIHSSGRVLAAGYSTGKFGIGAGDGAMEPFIASLDPGTGKMEQALQRAALGKSWIDMRDAVVSAKGEKVYWTGQSLNRTSDVFYSHVGEFTVPEVWNKKLKIGRSVGSPGPGNKDNSDETSGLPLRYVIYIASAAGFVFFIIVVVICCCYYRKRQQ